MAPSFYFSALGILLLLDFGFDWSSFFVSLLRVQSYNFFLNLPNFLCSFLIFLCIFFYVKYYTLRQIVFNHLIVQILALLMHLSFIHRHHTRLVNIIQTWSTSYTLGRHHTRLVDIIHTRSTSYTLGRHHTRLVDIMHTWSTSYMTKYHSAYQSSSRPASSGSSVPTGKVFTFRSGTAVPLGDIA